MFGRTARITFPAPARSKISALLLPALFAVASATAASAGDLKVSVGNVASNVGQVRVALYPEGVEFLKAGQAEAATFRTAMPGSMDFVFAGLPAGRYGVAVYHDANANAELDSNLLGIPTEGVGFSNAARASFGPPSFADVAVAVPAEGVVTTSAPLTY